MNLIYHENVCLFVFSYETTHRMWEERKYGCFSKQSVDLSITIILNFKTRSALFFWLKISKNFHRFVAKKIDIIQIFNFDKENSAF